MATAEIPDFLTVEEAGRVLRIGRTAAYQQAHRWLDTSSDGLPVVWVGGSLRVPLAQFEQHYNIRVRAIPEAAGRRQPKNVKAKAKSPGQDIPRSSRSTQSASRRKPREAAQAGLPFAG